MPQERRAIQVTFCYVSLNFYFTLQNIC